MTIRLDAPETYGLVARILSDTTTLLQNNSKVFYCYHVTPFFSCLDVVNGEVFIHGLASDVAWEALRMMGNVEDILDVRHVNRCYKHIRIWKEYVERFGPRRVTLNLTEVVWANRHTPRPGSRKIPQIGMERSRPSA